MTRHEQIARAQRTLSNCLHSRFLNSEPFFLRLIKMKLEFALYISSCRSFSAFNEMLKRLEDFQVLFNQSPNAVGLNSQFKYKRTPHKFIAPVFSLRRPIEIPFYWSNSLCQSTLIHTQTNARTHTEAFNLVHLEGMRRDQRRANAVAMPKRRRRERKTLHKCQTISVTKWMIMLFGRWYEVLFFSAFFNLFRSHLSFPECFSSVTINFEKVSINDKFLSKPMIVMVAPKSEPSKQTNTQSIHSHLQTHNKYWTFVK